MSTPSLDHCGINISVALACGDLLDFEKVHTIGLADGS
jgi:hypothetical protein